MRRFAMALLSAVLVGLLTGSCKTAPTPQDLWTPRELAASLAAQGWTMLPIPDGKVKPGSVIQVTGEGYRGWQGDLQNCGLPADLFAPVPGAIPAWRQEKKTKFDANVLLSIPGVVQAGPEFNRVRSVALVVDNSTADGIDLIRLNRQIAPPNPGLSGTCAAYANDPNMYLVNEALRVSKGKYVLYADTGAQLKLSGNAELSRVLNYTGNAGLNVTSDGALEFSVPVTIAVRRARRTDEALGFRTLSPGEQPHYADDLLKSTVR